MPSIVAVDDVMGCSHGYFTGGDVSANDAVFGSNYFEIVSQGTLGEASIDSSGVVTYQSYGGTGTDYVTYRVWDDWDSLGDTATITVNVTNQAPEGVADGFMTDHDTPLVIGYQDLTTNDLDGDMVDQWGGLTVSAVGSASNGSVSLVDGTITFTPNPDFVGNASFTYTVRDLIGATDTSVSVTVAVAASPWKYGNSTTTGKPGATVTRNTQTGVSSFSFAGKGPVNSSGRLRYTSSYVQNGITITDTQYKSITTDGQGAWTVNFTTNLPHDATVEYELEEVTSIQNGTPVYGVIADTEHTTTVKNQTP